MDARSNIDSRMRTGRDTCHEPFTRNPAAIKDEPFVSERSSPTKPKGQLQRRKEEIRKRGTSAFDKTPIGVLGNTLHPLHGRKSSHGPSSQRQHAHGHTETALPASKRSIDANSTVYLGHEGQVLALARYEDLLFSAAADGTAKAWDTYTHECLATYHGHRRAIWCILVTSQTLITGGADGTVRFWDIETAQSLHVLDLHSPIRDMATVGEFLVVAKSSPEIEVIDLNGMKRLRPLQGHLLAVSALTALSNGKRIVSGSHDTFIRIWDPVTGVCKHILGGHTGTIGELATAMLPRDRALESKGYIALNEENREEFLISGSGDTTVRVWGRTAALDGGWACHAMLQGHRHGVWAISSSPTSGVFASGGGDATVKVWAPVARLPQQTQKQLALEAGLSLERQDIEEEPEPMSSCQAWECVGGVRGTVGAVGAVLLTEDALNFGTSEALIANFRLESCMAIRR